MFRFILRKIYTPDIQVIAPPLITILVVLVLLFLLLQNGYKSITSQFSLLKSTKITEDVLKNKLEVLKQVSGGLVDNSSSVVIALPQKNPGMVVISQMRNFSEPNSIILKKVELKEETKLNDTTHKMLLSGEFEFTDYNNIIAFMNTLNSAAPLITLDKFESELTQLGALKGELRTSVYWADLPSQLPPLTEPVQELTQEEQTLLTRVTNLTQPVFTVTSPASPIERPNLFN